MSETKQPKGLREIEKAWSGPMGNEINTRIRFATWDALWLAISVSTGKSRDAIMRLLNEDMAKFDRYGHGDAA